MSEVPAVLVNSAVTPGAVFSGRFSLVPGFSAMSHHAAASILHPSCAECYVAVPNFPCLLRYRLEFRRWIAQRLADPENSCIWTHYQSSGS